MQTANIYLNFNGNCKEAFNFYKSILGGEYPYVGTFGDMPPQEGMPPLSELAKKRIMHISLPISKETILLGSDCPEDWGQKLILGNNFSISLNVGSTEEVDRILKLYLKMELL
ncbi:MAG: VOC family protein [Bacteroidota bacterium]